ncbi:hypothetical protein TYRP_015469 [Tyrophagus putrescentiae]|nr:hypothetical protein TYRP_015469 [Tyrophagus putrescentiae]
MLRKARRKSRLKRPQEATTAAIAWIDHRVAIAEPEEDGEEQVGDAVAAESSCEVDADDKAADDDAHRLGGFGLCVKALRLPGHHHLFTAARCITSGIASGTALPRGAGTARRGQTKSGLIARRVAPVFAVHLAPAQALVW